MICGALQTLNEDAFEDVAVSERPSPTGELTLQQFSLTPISEELGSPALSRHCDPFDNTSNYLNANNNRFDDSSQNPTVIIIPNYTSTDDTSV